MMKKAILVFFLVAVLALSACGGGEAPSVATADEAVNTIPAPEPPQSSEVLSLGDTFVFDDLEITFSSEITFATVESPGGDRHGADVIRVPISITNLSGETHRLMGHYYRHFGPDGLQLGGGVEVFFMDSLMMAGDMRSGATLNSYMYIWFEGDGDYYVEFSTMLSDPIEVRIPISK